MLTRIEETVRKMLGLDPKDFSERAKEIATQTRDDQKAAIMSRLNAQLAANPTMGAAHRAFLTKRAENAVTKLFGESVPTFRASDAVPSGIDVVDAGDGDDGEATEDDSVDSTVSGTHRLPKLSGSAGGYQPDPDYNNDSSHPSTANGILLNVSPEEARQARKGQRPGSFTPKRSK
jgi:hypothetical protein